jgi:hypothetical protein
MGRHRLPTLLTLACALIGLNGATAYAASDDWLVLRTSEVATAPEATAQRLNDAGVKAQVYVVPATGTAIGRFVIAEVAGGRHECQGEETVRLSTIQRSADMTTLRLSPSLLAESDGRFVFYVGRAAADGEQPVTGGSPGLAMDAPGLPSRDERIARARECDRGTRGAAARRPSRRAHRRSSRHA